MNLPSTLRRALALLALALPLLAPAQEATIRKALKAAGLPTGAI